MKAGKLSACYFWPGSAADIQGMRPNYTGGDYSDDVPNDVRVAQVVEWLRLEAPLRPSFISLYFSTVDSAGHSNGPDSDEVVRRALGGAQEKCVAHVWKCQRDVVGTAVHRSMRRLRRWTKSWATLWPTLPRWASWTRCVVRSGHSSRAVRQCTHAVACIPSQCCYSRTDQPSGGVGPRHDGHIVGTHRLAGQMDRREPGQLYRRVAGRRHLAAPGRCARLNSKNIGRAVVLTARFFVGCERRATAANVSAIFDRLKEGEMETQLFRAFWKDGADGDKPLERWHYRSSDRIPPILVVANEV